MINTNTLGHWIYEETFDINDYYGFIYIIICNTSKRRYIGKKSFHSTTRKKIKNRKNRKVIKKESNWKKYTGSSKELNADIKFHGAEHFTFTILKLCTTKGCLSYCEMEAQVFKDVLRSTLEDGTKEYYNKCIGSIKFIPPTHDH